MPSIKENCPVCKKLAVIARTQDMRSVGIQCIVYTLECSHSVTETISTAPIEPLDLTFNGYNGFHAFDYQKTGVQFVEHSNFDCLLADEMGLGKTPQGLLTFKRNRKNLTPTIVICKSSLHINWAREYMRWVLEIDPTDPEQVSKVPVQQLPWIHPTGDLGLPPGFELYLLSMDMLAKKPIQDSIKAMDIKCIIVDECHNFKDIRAKRTQALMEIAKSIPHKVFLSGTPIMNKAMEYFPILNILKPMHFPTPKHFAKNFLDYDWETKRWLGFTEVGKKRFFEMTKSYILRRECKDVQKDLPPVFLTTKPVSDFEKGLASQYNKLADDLEDALNDRKGRVAESSDILGIMSNMRHLTGLMKVPAILDHITEFLESTDEKITIGIHHVAVRNMLMAALNEYNPIEISGADNGIQKDAKITEFKRPDRRILIANILAGGEGLNIQFCNNFVIAERQWNPAKEKQFIKRFHRQGQTKTVMGTNIVAADTIDDFFEQLNSLKDNVTTDAMDADLKTDTQFIRNLARKVVATRLRVVGL